MKMQVDYEGQCQWDIRGSRSQSFYTDHQHFQKTSFSPFSAWPAVVSSMNSPLLSSAMIVTYRHWMWWMSLYSTPSHYPILRRAEQCFDFRWYNKEVHLFIYHNEMPFNGWNSPLSHLKMRKSILNYISFLCHLDTFHERYSWRTSQPHQPLSVSVAVINLSIPCRLSGAVPLSQFIYTSTLDFTTTPLRKTMDSSFRFFFNPYQISNHFWESWIRNYQWCKATAHFF